MPHPVAAALAAAALLAGSPGAGEPGPDGEDRLVVTATATGSPADEERHTLRCHPAGGDHPEARAACDALDAATASGGDPFAPVPGDALCTQIFGGPHTARIRGWWAGRHVDAEFARTNGCEITRWDALVPALPSAGD